MFKRQNTAFVRAHTNIPAPQPQYHHLQDTYIFYFIPAKMLHACWDEMSFFRRFRVACTLRKYVKILRGLSRDIPGSVDGGHISNCVFGDDPTFQGPFKNVTIFRQWCEYMSYGGWRRNQFQEYESPAAFFNTCDWSLVVFNHCDLSLCNLILSEDGVLWVVDWEHSGFYPPWVELAGMGRYTKVPESWKRWWPFICGGSYSDLENPLKCIREFSTMTSTMIMEPRTEFFPPNRD